MIRVSYKESQTIHPTQQLSGSALKPDTQIGPVVDQTQLDQDLPYIRHGRAEGARLVSGGELLNRDTPGFYLSPALFKDVDNRIRIAREEIFGPVAIVTRAKGYDEALELANLLPPDTTAAIFWLKNRNPTQVGARPGRGRHVAGAMALFNCVD
jgi:acyl-CoA reductase-like NAD-dependent aldehyde dehydrogenase